MPIGRGRLENVRMNKDNERRFPREILIDVRDADGLLLRGARVHWRENGHDRGGIRAADGHAKINPIHADSTLDLEVDYEGNSQRQKLAVAQNTWTFRY